MNSRTKINLINNYVELYKILYECKENIKNAVDTQVLYEFKELTISTVKLKDRYENIFKICGLYDESFLLLKEQLNEALLSPNPHKHHSIKYELLSLKKSNIEADLLRFSN